ncbi:uncharacterized protein LOC123528195 [Mercenaria mercenaria]|uniref:uncharacterized protein LOC123528195 n=1 Tax=Mercenaria mercenaria TaxID=6596 RepID=UPI00234F9D67|nr:uncharacterized protein LOC123528195 [Mercenaria mercenaria]
MANLLLYIINIAVLFSEADGQLNTERIHTLKRSSSPLSESRLVGMLSPEGVPRRVIVPRRVDVPRPAGVPKPQIGGGFPDIRSITSRLGLSLSTPYTARTFVFLTANQLKKLPTRDQNGTRITTSEFDMKIYKLGDETAFMLGLILPKGQTEYMPSVTKRIVNDKKMLSDHKTKRVFPFEVAVLVSKPTGPIRNTVVPLSADMTVLDAFVSATRMYMDKTTTEVENIPFNIMLDWNTKLQCYVTIKASGIRNRRRKAWHFIVKDFTHGIVYRDRCLPGDNVVLRPGSIVQLAFEQKRRRPK